jgi:hypothetical protein
VPAKNKNGKIYYGTFISEHFFIVNILSCLLLQKPITYNIFQLNNRININLLENTIGILIRMNEHMCAFYICENVMKFMNNHIIINYNWIKLFKMCNILSNRCIKYKIYFNYSILDKIGPFIYYNNKMIYFNDSTFTIEENIDNLDESTLTIKENKDNFDYSKDENYLNILSFIFLTYTDKINFKNNNNIHYSNYYIQKNEITEYRNFIINYNISGLELNKFINDLWTPLYRACDKGYEEIVKLLLEQPGIDVNKSDFAGYTPLHRACFSKNIKIVELLLLHPNIDVNKLSTINKLNNKIFTPLYLAVQTGCIEIVELLLKNPKIKIEYNNDLVLSPLNCAISKKFTKIIELLQNYSML